MSDSEFLYQILQFILFCSRFVLSQDIPVWYRVNVDLAMKMFTFACIIFFNVSPSLMTVTGVAAYIVKASVDTLVCSGRAFVNICNRNVQRIRASDELIAFSDG